MVGNIGHNTPYSVHPFIGLEDPRPDNGEYCTKRAGVVCQEWSVDKLFCQVTLELRRTELEQCCGGSKWVATGEDYSIHSHRCTWRSLVVSVVATR
eukprot:6476731-Amphidinium_carterae.1